MIGGTIGDMMIGGPSATGEVTFTSAAQSGLFGIHVEWAYEGEDASDNIYFLVYVDGEFSRRLAGSESMTDLLVSTFNPVSVEVIPWRAYQLPPDELYGAVATTRAHLKWSRVTDTSLSAYKIYHSTDNVDYDEYATHSTLGLQARWVETASGALARVDGLAGPVGHTNTLFTVEVTDVNELTVTNDKDAIETVVTFSVGSPASLVEGVTITFYDPPVEGETVTFISGIQPEYNSAALEAGTHYFKISAVDGADNESSQSSAIPVLISPAPEPVSSFSLAYDTDDDTIRATFAQSASPDATSVRIYSNYASVTGTLLDAPMMTTPLATVTVGPSVGIVATLLLAATGKPAGVYQFVPKAVTSAGVEDLSSVVYTFTLPYVPDDLPTLANLTATATANGGVTLSWSSDSEHSEYWYVSKVSGPSGGTLPDFAEVTPTLTADDQAFTYSVSYAAADLGAEGTYVLSVQASDSTQTYLGTAQTVTVTTDATAPAAPTGLIGTAF